MKASVAHIPKFAMKAANSIGSSAKTGVLSKGGKGRISLFPELLLTNMDHGTVPTNTSKSVGKQMEAFVGKERLPQQKSEKKKESRKQ